MSNLPVNNALMTTTPAITSLIFAGGALIIKPTETGFEAIIGEGFTIDDATKAFVDGLNHYMKQLKL